MLFRLFIFVILFNFCTSLRHRTLRFRQNDTHRTFAIDRENRQFLRNGKPHRLISGTIHHYQVPQHLWRDGLLKLRALGCNTLQFYVAWHQHEPTPGVFVWNGRANITQYMQIAQELGLDVVLRLGPYMDAEQDMGGLPAWLMKHEGIKLRTSHKPYKKAVYRYFKRMLKIVKPLLYPNGGPVIMLQVENEYGSYYACDRDYMHWLLDMVKTHLNTTDVVYFTDDGGGIDYLVCGYVYDAYPAVDFGVQSSCKGVNEAFAAQDRYSPRMNAEFYPGWFDQWGDAHHTTVPTQPILDTMTCMYNVGASFNIYPVHGGTNWGFQAGAETTKGYYTSVTTSYDFDAPIAEGGEITPKYHAIRQHIERLTNTTNPYDIPVVAPKMWHGPLKFSPIAQLSDIISWNENKNVESTYPLTAEMMGYYYGFIVYKNVIRKSGKLLKFPGVNDRGYIFKNNTLVHVTQRGLNQTSFISTKFQRGDELTILVENQGRICYGTFINDTKGLTQNVTLDGRILTDWTAHHISLGNNLDELRRNRQHRRQTSSTSGYIPAMYFARFQSKVDTETYIDTSGWGKGQIVIDNDKYHMINLGRYWPLKGPQRAMYHPYVAKGVNTIYVFELDKPNPHFTMTLVNRPVLT